MRITQSVWEITKETNMFRGLVLVAIACTLPCARPGMAQAPGPAAFIQRASALQFRLSVWQRVLNEMILDKSLLPNLSLSDRRNGCIMWIKTTDGAIAKLEQKPTLGAETLLLSNLTFLDNALLNLNHSLELAGAIESPVDEPPGMKQEEERIAAIRNELRGFYAQLSFEAFQQLHAVGEASHVKRRQRLHGPGEISGHVYRADTSKPLANVVITLESPAAPNNGNLQRTGADGSYEFRDLAPGNYWVIAYRSGFVGSVYGIDASQNASKGLVSVASGQRHADINIQLIPVPPITVLSGGDLDKLLPQKEGPFAYGPGAFSPDGKQFALAVAGLEPEQVCLYVINSSGLKCLQGPSEPRLPLSNRITYLAWINNTLYAQTNYTGGGPGFLFQIGSNGPRLLQMTTPGGMRMLAYPKTIVNGFRQEHDEAAGAGFIHFAAGNHQFTVTAWEGQLAMATPDGEDPYIIATGGKELGSFVFDAARSLVFYPVPGRYYSAIVSFNLNTREYRTTALPFGEGLRLLDAKQEFDGTMVAYLVDGPCVPKPSPNGEVLGILPNESQPAFLPPNVCLAKISNAQGR